MLKIFVKKWIFISILIIFNLIIGVRTSMKFFYFFFWFLIAVSSLSIAWVLVQYLTVRLEIKRRAPYKVDEDDTLKVEIEITNRSFLPVFEAVIEDNLACAGPAAARKRILLDYLGPGFSRQIRYSCRCPQRGRYRLGPFSIYLFDPWGLFFLKKTSPGQSELYVYPRAFNIRRFPVLVKGGMPWFGIETARVSGDEDEFFGIREYKEKDPIKTIHWFSTAKRNKLIVKQFQRQSFYRATLIFNLEKEKNFGAGKESVCEYIVKIAASVSKYMLERNVALEVIAHTGDLVHIPYNKGADHLENIFKFLASAQAESRVGLGEVFQEFSRFIPHDSSLIVVMPDTDWDCLPLFLSLKSRNVSLLPLVVVTASFLYNETQREGKITLPESLHINPIIFSCGGGFEDAFLKY